LVSVDMPPSELDAERGASVSSVTISGCGASVVVVGGAVDVVVATELDVVLRGTVVDGLGWVVVVTGRELVVVACVVVVDSLVVVVSLLGGVPPRAAVTKTVNHSAHARTDSAAAFLRVSVRTLLTYFSAGSPHAPPDYLAAPRRVPNPIAAGSQQNRVGSGRTKREPQR
jgi:hypothetical protein